MYFAPIVEGHGEVHALPALLHRLANEGSTYAGPLRVNHPIRVKAGSFVTDDAYLSRYVSLACAKAAQERGVVLILLDCEDDCPATRGPDLLAKAKAVRNDVDIIVALAYREYETWFLTAAKSLRLCCGLPADLEPPDDPERVRGAKEWLGRHMSMPYDPVTHQLELTRVFDMAIAAENDSFSRLRRHIQALLREA